MLVPSLQSDASVLQVVWESVFMPSAPGAISNWSLVNEGDFSPLFSLWSGYPCLGGKSSTEAGRGMSGAWGVAGLSPSPGSCLGGHRDGPGPPGRGWKRSGHSSPDPHCPKAGSGLKPVSGELGAGSMGFPCLSLPSLPGIGSTGPSQSWGGAEALLLLPAVPGPLPMAGGG